ncbi:hypothetical protein BVG19_g3968 [[Candida] boidinii]|nr:hypothetical protein BVG19_g3968 [[Candida] boidinii]OWB51354.1 hypothetical protein B5S27_g2914 [[Candida] boidinii]
MTDLSVNSILTEHLDVAPITVIDEIINTVNDVMYKCTSAMEKFLIERQVKLKDNYMRKKKERQSRVTSAGDDDVIMEEGVAAYDNDDEYPYSNETEKDEVLMIKNCDFNEISLGTAKLETLLESSVDRNFDKFELYALRNIFMIPKELIDEGLIRLEHHKDLVIDSDCIQKSSEIDESIKIVLQNIENELIINKYLNFEIKRMKILFKEFKKLNRNIKFLHTNNPEGLSNSIMIIISSIIPISDTIHYLFVEIKNLFEKFTIIRQLLTNPIEEGGVKGLHIGSSERDKYINTRSIKILKELNLLFDDKIGTEKLNLLKRINKSFNQNSKTGTKADQ